MATALTLLVFLLLSTSAIQASENQFITIVNPVRISRYTKDPSLSLLAEYSVVKKHGLPATWLLTYDAMLDKDIASVVAKMDKSQTFGVFLEVTPSFAKAAQVTYNDTGNWHHAVSVFLSGYSQEDRIKLIDKIFETFKNNFGHYPEVTGSWWTDAFSLSYMQQKYGIVANLGVSDQFSTDGYQVWGQPWSTVYYPSKYHPAVPANSKENKLDVVMFQWAPRDPLNGYRSSLYSTQDYVVTTPKLDTKYFEKLVNLYAKKNGNLFGQITVGLEADLDPEGYRGEFDRQMGLVRNLIDSGEIEAKSVKDFSDWYRKEFPEFSPSHKIEAEDLLGSGKRVGWYTSPFYRVGVVYDIEKNETRIFDLRVYDENLTDPYYLSPNFENTLSINIPSLIDEISDETSVRKIKGIAKIDFEERAFFIDGEKVEVNNNLKIDKFGRQYKAYSSESVHFFKRKRAIFDLLLGRGWEYFKKTDFFVPQDEILALLKLSRLASGKVLVFDGECLQCRYHTKFKHPAFANQRGYVKDYGKHPIVYNSSIFGPNNKDKVKEIIKRLGVKYIYLVKFEEYIEKLPFSPGDLGVEKIFSNANAEIWRVK